MIRAFEELPRAKLVKKSMERPDLIDAGFTSFVQGWQRTQNEQLTKVEDRISLKDQMKYRAIIDVSPKAPLLPLLLCIDLINSVRFICLRLMGILGHLALGGFYAQTRSLSRYVLHEQMYAILIYFNTPNA